MPTDFVNSTMCLNYYFASIVCAPSISAQYTFQMLLMAVAVECKWFRSQSACYSTIHSFYYLLKISAITTDICTGSHSRFSFPTQTHRKNHGNFFKLKRIFTHKWSSMGGFSHRSTPKRHSIRCDTVLLPRTKKMVLFITKMCIIGACS